MGRLRINIAGLMGLVVVAAIGLAALRDRSSMLANFVFALALGLNFAAIVAAIAWQDRVRFFAVGYAACGWGYLVLVSVIPWFDSFLCNNVITPQFLEWVSPGHFRSGPNEYALLAHSLLDIAAGLAGGLLAWNLVPRPSDPARSTTKTTGNL